MTTAEDGSNIPNDVDQYYRHQAEALLSANVFGMSTKLSTKERIEIFKNENSEFSGLSDEQVIKLINIYDANLKRPHEPNDIPLAMVGGGILFTGWIFFNTASAYEIVDITETSQPALIFANTLLAPACASLTYYLFEQTKFSMATA